MGHSGDERQRLVAGLPHQSPGRLRLLRRSDPVGASGGREARPYQRTVRSARRRHPRRPESFDLITAFDAIHDQAHPARVLAAVARALRSDGVFLMVDIKASSNVEDNLHVPWAPFLYTVSTLHCMTVSLALGGDGLGTAWGHQLATSMLHEAGFGSVEIREVEDDPVNNYYVCRR